MKKILAEDLVPTGYLPYRHRNPTTKQYNIATKYLENPYKD